MHTSHCRKNTTDGWNLDQGLAAQYAAQAGLDPDLAADAGEEVWDVLKSLRDATSATDPQRQAKLVRRTKARLAKTNLNRHGELAQHIEAKLLALQGRGGDTELAHLTPGEMIVPPQLQTPEVVQALQQAANNTGIDLRRYTAGSQASSVNPETGLEEFSVECADEGGCRQEPGGYRGPNIYDYDGTTYVNVTGTSTSPTGQYDSYSADNWAGGPDGSGRGGSGSGGVPYGPEPANETISEPIDTLIHRFVYDENGNLVPKQPGVTYYDPSQFSGIGGNPSISLNPIGSGSIVPEPGSTPDGSKTPAVPSPEPIEKPPIPVEPWLNDILTDPSSATDDELEQARRNLFANAGHFAAIVGAGAIGAPKRFRMPVFYAGGLGSTWFILMVNRIEHEIKNRRDAGTWTGR